MLAIVSMVLDHIGIFFFPEVLGLRLVGRLAFPLFAWGVASGAKYTSDVGKYLKRLLVFGVISQVPYYLVFKEAGFQEIQLNIFFTLAMGLLGIVWSRKYDRWWQQGLVVGLIAGLAQWLGMEYGGYGVLVIVVFYYWYGRLWWLLGLQMLLVLGFFTGQGVYKVVNERMFGYEAWMLVVQIVSLGSLWIISNFNGKRGWKFGWLYWVYGGHLLIIWVVRKAIGG